MSQQMSQWEIWLANFPFEEDTTIEKERPVIIIAVDDEELEVLSVKVTSQKARDDYDIEIKNWQQAGLIRPSVARISKTMNLSKDKFTSKIGDVECQDRIDIMQKFMDFVVKSKKAK